MPLLDCSWPSKYVYEKLYCICNSLPHMQIHCMISQTENLNFEKLYLNCWFAFYPHKYRKLLNLFRAVDRLYSCFCLGNYTIRVNLPFWESFKLYLSVFRSTRTYLVTLVDYIADKIASFVKRVNGSLGWEQSFINAL